MVERPILFSGPMVRAILDGAKSQTRRIVKIRGDLPPAWATFASEGHSIGAGPTSRRTGLFYWSEEQTPGQAFKVLRRWPLTKRGPMQGSHYHAPCPYGAPGDRLWVRESWQYADWTEDGEPYIRYRADDAVRFCEGAGEGEELIDVWAELSATENYSIDNKAADRSWRPSIFMPRWASRLTLTITDVRVEPLQDISEADARAEGVERSVSGYWHNYAADGPTHQSARESYRSLWDSINAKRGYKWDRNLWVWVVSFERSEAAHG